MFNPQPKENVPILTGKAYTKFKKEIYERNNECCQKCGRWVPLTNQDGVFNNFTCAHLAHIKPRKKYGDIPENVQIECFDCHIAQGHLKWRSDKTHI